MCLLGLGEATTDDGKDTELGGIKDIMGGG